MLSTLRKTASRPAARKILARGFAKEIKFGVDGRAAMLEGVNTLADAVQVREIPVCTLCFTLGRNFRLYLSTAGWIFLHFG